MTGSGVPYPYRMPIRSYVCIKRHSIVGAEAVILPGVTIGEGAVVGANSLVKGDCEPGQCMPARLRGQQSPVERTHPGAGGSVAKRPL